MTPEETPPDTVKSTFAVIRREWRIDWRRIAAYTVVTPIVVFGVALAHGPTIDVSSNPIRLAAMTAMLSFFGASVAAAFSVRTVVRARMRHQQSLAFVLKLTFGFGALSFFILWCPLSIVAFYVGLFLWTTGIIFR